MLLNSAALRRIAAVSATGLLAMVFAPCASASVNGLVISQIYGGGGNAGATLKSDFIEVFNGGANPINLAGYSVQYTSSTGTAWQVTNLTSVMLSPGQYYLIKEADGTGGTTNLPTPDATGVIPMSGTAGKVLLVNTTTAQSGAAPTGSQIIDRVAFGSGATPLEGSPTPAPSNTTAVLRNASGCTDTDMNSTDFTAGTPLPRNTLSAANACGGGTGGTSFTIDSPTAVNEGAAGTTTSILFTVTKTGSAAADVTVTTADNTAKTADNDYVANTATLSFAAADTTKTFAVTVNGDDVTEPTETFSAVLSAPTNSATLGTPSSGTGTITNDDLAAASARIYQIQGPNHNSPMVGMNVTNVPGIVTAVCGTGCSSAKGFFMQDATGDGDNNTSDGILVFTSTNPTVTIGQTVAVSGTVQEFRQITAGTACEGSIASGPCLRTTEIGNVTSVTVTNAANNLASIAPVVIGTGGRIIPNSAIYSGTTQVSVEDAAYVFNPAANAIDFFESLEGMRVQVNNARVVSPTKTFSSGSEFYVVGDQFANSNDLPNASGGLTVVGYADPQPERVQIDSGIFGSPPQVIVGDSIAGSVVGVMGNSFGNYELLNTQAYSVTSGGLAKASSSFTPGPQATASNLIVAAYNVENLGGNGAQAKFDTIGSEVVNRLKSPDIISVSEVQDNNGATDDGTVSASTTISKIIAAIQAAGGPTYSAVSIDPVNDQDGGQPGGNIRIVFFYNAARVSLVSGTSGAGDSTTATAVTTSGGKLALTLSPGRIAPTNTAWNSSRKPLAATFDFNGQRVVVVGNHFNSKGGDDGAFGRLQPPGRSSEVQRGNQATLVNNFVSTILATVPNTRVVVMGDLNDFGFSNTLNILRTGSSVPANGTESLFNLGEQLVNPPRERHSYVFDGVSQELDHILVTGALLPSAAFKAIRFNSEFPDQTSDHDPLAASLIVDCAPGTLSFKSAPYSVSEAATSLTVTVQRTGGSCGAVGVSYATGSGSGGSLATANTDYTSTSGTLSWADGDVADKTFTVSIINDTVNEADEIFGLGLSTATGGAAFAGGASTLATTATILDDDALPTVSFATASSSFGEAAGSVAVTVSLDVASGRDVTVPFIIGGTATAGAGGDYTQTTATPLTIPAGTTSRTISFLLNDDAAVESDETITLAFDSGVLNAQIGTPASHTLTIVDNDTPAQDTLPDAFSFQIRTGISASTVVTSELVTLTGFTGTISVSVSNGGLCSVQSGAFAASCSITPGQTLQVRHTSAATTGTTKDSTVTVGTGTALFRSITSDEDRVPDAFAFATQSNVAGNSVVMSDVITLAGYNAPAFIDATQAGVEYRIAGGAWTSAKGSLPVGATLQLRHLTATGSLAYTKSKIRVGGVDGSFTTRNIK